MMAFSEKKVVRQPRRIMARQKITMMMNLLKREDQNIVQRKHQEEAATLMLRIKRTRKMQITTGSIIKKVESKNGGMV